MGVSFLTGSMIPSSIMLRTLPVAALKPCNFRILQAVRSVNNTPSNQHCERFTTNRFFNRADNIASCRFISCQNSKSLRLGDIAIDPHHLQRFLLRGCTVALRVFNTGVSFLSASSFGARKRDDCDTVP